MKRDNLEQFIWQERDAFDDAIPSLHAWAGIEKALQQNQKPARVRVSWLKVSAIAASVALLIISGMFIGLYLANPAADGQAMSLSQVSPEHAEMESYFQNTIDDKLAQLAKYEASEPYKGDLQALDEVMAELQEELRNAPAGGEQRIIENMILNYQAKLQILERVLERLQQTNQQIDKSQPKQNAISI